MTCEQAVTPMAAEPGQRSRGISGSTIKIIAVVTMLIDHVAAALLTRILITRGIYDIMSSSDMGKIMEWLMENAVLYYGVILMRYIGRLGFPLFCFLLVEGFQKTHDVKKYAIRLGIFALISEIPFDLAISGKFFDLDYQNVYFTLVIGILALCAVKWLAEKELPKALSWVLTVTGVLAPAGYALWMSRVTMYGFHQYLAYGTAVIAFGATLGVLISKAVRQGLPAMQKVCVNTTVVVLFMLFADLLKTDYSGMGVLTIVAMYVFRRRKVISALSGCIVLNVMSLSELTAFFALIPVALYNGKRGMKMKYFFYAFYPAHLLIIWLIALAMGIGWIPAV